MRAAVAHTIPTRELDICDVEAPPVGVAELLLEVEACGICGTDLHILSGESYRPETMPFVLGHEPVGIVIEAGASADTSWLGRRVTITPFRGCGTCELCATGADRLCSQLRGITGVSSSWGGYAEMMVVHERQVVLVPEGLPVEAAATLVDAGATAMNAARVAGSTHGLTVIVGGGPVGFVVAELLRESHDLVLVEPAAPRREVLHEFGHRVVANADEIEYAVQLVIDCAGVPAIAPWAVDRLGARGLYLLVGYCSVPLMNFAPVARKELTITGVRSGSREDLAAVLDLAATQAIRLPPVDVWPLERVNEALDGLRRGTVAGKAILTPKRASGSK